MLTRRAMMAGLAAMPFAGALAQTRSPRVGGAPIGVRDKRLWVNVSVARHGPYPFVIDTGSFANMIRGDLARELDLSRLVGSLAVYGISGGERFQMVRGAPVLMGGVDIGLSEFAVFENAAQTVHPEARGIMSSLMLTTVDSEFDFEAGEWRVYPDGRPAAVAAAFQPIPSRIDGQQRGHGAPKVSIDLALDGRTYRLHVDTGAPGQILLWGSATRQAGLWSDDRPYAPTVLNGFGALDRPGRLVRAGEARFGAIAFPRPLVMLVPQGGTRDSGADGLIGLEMLQQLNIGTDMRARRVLAMRNRRPAPAERYSMTGMWIEERGERLAVAQLSPHSPAAEAGLQVGDEITGTALRPLIARLSGRPGARIALTYRRGGQERTAEVVLRPFL